jgi:hypothetical protein
MSNGLDKIVALVSSIITRDRTRYDKTYRIAVITIEITTLYTLHWTQLGFFLFGTDEY